MARVQNYERKQPSQLNWSELLEEYGHAERDFGSEVGTGDDARRAMALHSEIVNRVMRADMAYPGCMKLLEGDAL
jgi:hypothetical protein